MALLYRCSTCETQYEATISGNAVVYTNGNMRTVIRSEDDPCYTCQQEINKTVEAKKAEIRAKKGQNNANSS